MRLQYLPPYSPHLSPIEEGFSSMKSWLRKNHDRADYDLGGGGLDADPYPILWEAVFNAMTSDSSKGWFHHCGYL
jgi:hypothetical protein